MVYIHLYKNGIREYIVNICIYSLHIWILVEISGGVICILRRRGCETANYEQIIDRNWARLYNICVYYI